MLNERLKTEMRYLYWYVTDDKGMQHERSKLQYRQRVKRRPKNPSEYRTGHRVEVWSDWQDIPIVWKDEL